MMSTGSSLASIFVALGIILITKWVLTRVSAGARLPYPPGPKAVPFIGNALDLPTQDAARVFAEWSKKSKSKFLIPCTVQKHLMSE